MCASTRASSAGREDSIRGSDAASASSLHAWDYYRPTPHPFLACGRATVVLMLVERHPPCLYTNEVCRWWGLPEHCTCPLERIEYVTPQGGSDDLDDLDGHVCPVCAIELVGFDTLLWWSWTDEATVSQRLARHSALLGQRELPG